jgi:hypothetical protein
MSICGLVLEVDSPPPLPPHLISSTGLNAHHRRRSPKIETKKRVRQLLSTSVHPVVVALIRGQVIYPALSEVFQAGRVEPHTSAT